MNPMNPKEFIRLGLLMLSCLLMQISHAQQAIYPTNPSVKIAVAPFMLSNSAVIPGHQDVAIGLTTTLNSVLYQTQLLQTDQMQPALQFVGTVLYYQDNILYVRGELYDQGQLLVVSQIEHPMPDSPDWRQALGQITLRMLDELMYKLTLLEQPAAIPYSYYPNLYYDNARAWYGNNGLGSFYNRVAPAYEIVIPHHQEAIRPIERPRGYVYEENRPQHLERNLENNFNHGFGYNNPQNVQPPANNTVIPHHQEPINPIEKPKGYVYEENRPQHLERNLENNFNRGFGANNPQINPGPSLIPGQTIPNNHEVPGVRGENQPHFPAPVQENQNHYPANKQPRIEPRVEPRNVEPVPNHIEHTPPPSNNATEQNRR